MLHLTTYKLQNPKKMYAYFMVSVPPAFRRAYSTVPTQRLHCYTATIKRKPVFLASITKLSTTQPLYAELANVEEVGKYSLSQQGSRGMRIAVPRHFVRIARLKPSHKLSCHIDGDTLIYQKEK